MDKGEERSKRVENCRREETENERRSKKEGKVRRVEVRNT